MISLEGEDGSSASLDLVDDAFGHELRIGKWRNQNADLEAPKVDVTVFSNSGCNGGFPDEKRKFLR